jgi:hypothetical protein
MLLINVAKGNVSQLGLRPDCVIVKLVTENKMKSLRNVNKQ